MKISDEIRDWCEDTTPWPSRNDARAIADRIDHEMVELPKDADGVPICVGDTVWGCVSGMELIVNGMRLTDTWAVSTNHGLISRASDVTHERPDSLDRIADELDKWRVDAAGDCQARLVRRSRNELNGGTSEIWDIGDSVGVYVDFNPCPSDTGIPETMAFPIDLSENAVTSWNEMDVWYEDATGGKAIRELGYEIEAAQFGVDLSEEGIWGPKTLEAIEDRCNKDGSYETDSTNVRKSTLREWADRVRKLSDKEDE